MYCQHILTFILVRKLRWITGLLYVKYRVKTTEWSVQGWHPTPTWREFPKWTPIPVIFKASWGEIHAYNIHKQATTMMATNIYYTDETYLLLFVNKRVVKVKTARTRFEAAACMPSILSCLPSTARWHGRQIRARIIRQVAALYNTRQMALCLIRVLGNVCVKTLIC